MPLIAVPNVSEGREPEIVAGLVAATSAPGARILDVHSDAVHNRSVITATAPDEALVEAMVSLARACSELDLSRHSGIHPRLGTLDVCPFVFHETVAADAVRAAHRAGEAIHAATGIPVYFYGLAARRDATRSLPDIRRGGLSGLVQRAGAGMPPDVGTAAEIKPATGVVCVGARGYLVAFNVWLDCEPAAARAIAAGVRASSGGLPGVRALGLLLQEPRSCQVSMNLTEPHVTGIERAFARVRDLAGIEDARIIATEIVGLVPQRHLPAPDTAVARLLLTPGHSLEAALEDG